MNELTLLSGIDLFPFRDLHDIIQWLHEEGGLSPVVQPASWVASPPSCLVDFADIKGQVLAKRALEIAASGRHNLLLVGPPGTGKSMLAQAMTGILPSWTLPEALDATAVHSVAGTLPGGGLLPQRPYRNPHHTISAVGLLGGGDIPSPGEISLAHRGVLFLDELPEIRRDALEALRQPLEQGVIHIQRVKGRATYPADFLLLAAMNPCPCGFLGHPKKECQCTALRIQKYVGKVSGPLLDRIDLQVELPALNVGELFEEKKVREPSSAVKSRVEKARKIQEERYRHIAGRPRDNAHLSPKDIRRFCALTSDGEVVLKASVERLGLTARAFDRIRKVARTIADLDASDIIEARHVAESIQYRLFDRARTSNY